MAYQTAPNAAFAIHAGDLVDQAHRDQEWAEWFKAGGFIHRQWTSIPAAGNHEFSLWEQNTRRLSIQWRPQFTLPVENSCLRSCTKRSTPSTTRTYASSS